MANCIYKHVIPLEFVAKNLLTKGALRQRGGVKDFVAKGGGDIVAKEDYLFANTHLIAPAGGWVYCIPQISYAFNYFCC